MQKHKKNKHEHQDTAIINLTGDMKENIQDLIVGLNCKCGASNHLRAILTVYSDKINKLRAQRDNYKSMCQQMCNYLQSLQNRQSSKSLSLQSTKQPEQMIKQQSNIFQLLHNELHTPFSLQLQENTYINLDKEQQQFLMENPNPQDSLLLSQSSRNKTQRVMNFIPKASKQTVGKSFQQFLQEKIQENYVRLKVTQDMKTLDSKRDLFKSPPFRKPLGNKIMKFLN